MKDIDTLWAFIAENQDGDQEGIIAAMLPGLGATPLVFAKEHNAMMMRPIAQHMAKQGGKVVRLTKFTKRRDLETFEP